MNSLILNVVQWKLTEGFFFILFYFTLSGFKTYEWSKWIRRYVERIKTQRKLYHWQWYWLRRCAFSWRKYGWENRRNTYQGLSIDQAMSKRIDVCQGIRFSSIRIHKHESIIQNEVARERDYNFEHVLWRQHSQKWIFWWIWAQLKRIQLPVYKFWLCWPKYIILFLKKIHSRT